MGAAPIGAAFHHGLLIEPTLLGLHVEVQVDEERLALIEGQGLTFKENEETGQTLMTVEQQNRMPLLFCSAAPHLAGIRCLPGQEVASGMLPIERLDKATDLIALPDVTSLEFGQKDFT